MFTSLNPGAIGAKADLQQGLQLAARHGFDGYHVGIGEAQQLGAERVLELAADADVRLSAFGFPLDFRADEAAFERDLKALPALAQTAADLEVRRTATWIVPASDELTYADNLAQHARRLKPAAAILADHGIRLGLEYVGPRTSREGKKHEFAHTMDQMGELCAAVGDNCGYLLDAWHWYTAHEDAAHLLRSMALEDARDGRPDFHRAALALISLGVEIATEIIGPDTFRHSELRELAHAITDIPQVSVEEQHEHLATFARQLEAREWIRTGGVDFAYRAVRGARGMRMAQYVSEQVADTSRPRFTILNKVPAAQVAPRIASEHPQTIALLLSQLEPEQAGAILAQLSERLQADVAYRIATIDEAAPTAVRDLETVLEDTFRDAVAGKTEIGGTDVTAQILQASTTAVERNVLQQMDAQVPEIAAVLRELGCRREGTDAGDKSGEAT